MQKEVQLLKSLDHPNIVQYLDSCILSYSINQYHQERLGYICMELGSYNLDDFKQAGYPIDNTLIDQTLNALAYLQRKHIAHCDIKPANILVMELKPICYKICDVGSSKLQSSELVDSVGTYKYMSPEMLQGDAKNYYLSDVFSLGLLYLSIYKDFSISHAKRCEITPQEFIQKLHAKINQDEDDVSILLRKMIQLDPKDRLDFIQLEQFWEDHKRNKIKQSMLDSKEGSIRFNSNTTFLQDDSPLKSSPYKIGRLTKKLQPNSKQSFYSQGNNFSNEKNNSVLPFSSNQITDRKTATSTRQRVQSFQLKFESIQKPAKSPEKPKLASPLKQNTNNKFQLPQLPLQHLKIRLIQS
ncbi:unnamed protein product (macronuclear) [Paramecium tetraurelia]|uniref:Protein kinase domain-containing protein n=1 Tax=Paramecium tetraurelia TaxID=5888 RepID=A0DL99_PARTE|nr:uncharacterized protein GSPATT00018133001 [Paramecium tetraurelia]CAK83816.1 unnamed protein product [Paramecium tetraurelia]|eukprot:XP_001451213.1 hypothetical protein (macronuclear) [Paramecium tetraurelia strain d4-2]